MWERVAGLEKTQRLLCAALCRSHTLPVKEGYPDAPVSFEWARRVFPNAFAYFIEHRDGFRTTLFMLPIQDFNYAGLDGETGAITSCLMYLPMPGSSATTADFFNPLVNHIERMIGEGKAPYPVERTLLTSGMTLKAVDSLFRQEALLATPELNVDYRPSAKSQFWRA